MCQVLNFRGNKAKIPNKLTYHDVQIEILIAFLRLTIDNNHHQLGESLLTRQVSLYNQMLE